MNVFCSFWGSVLKHQSTRCKKHNSHKIHQRSSLQSLTFFIFTAHHCIKHLGQTDARKSALRLRHSRPACRPAPMLVTHLIPVTPWNSRSAYPLPYSLGYAVIFIVRIVTSQPLQVRHIEYRHVRCLVAINRKTIGTTENEHLFVADVVT
jgi:hypothetical protein